jgi:hypothetical protein
MREVTHQYGQDMGGTAWLYKVVQYLNSTLAFCDGSVIDLRGGQAVGTGRLDRDQLGRVRLAQGGQKRRMPLFLNPG